jgi:hypothetical protein
MVGVGFRPEQRRVVAGVVIFGAAIVLLLYTVDVISHDPLRKFAKSSTPSQPLLPTALPTLASKYGCKHFYFDLGTNNAGSIADFINKSAADDKGQIVRGLNQYREAQNLALKDFCVFGFEPNPRHSPSHRQVEAAFASVVSHVQVFSESIAGIKDGDSVLQIDKYEGEYPSWGSSVLSGFGPIANQGNTTSVSVKSVDFGRFVGEAVGDQGAPGKVIMRMDIEGSEYVLLRKFMGLVCKHVDHLEIEWHAHQLTPPPDCIQATLHWMLSEDSCRPRWQRSGGVQGCDPWKISDAFSG